MPSVRSRAGAQFCAQLDDVQARLPAGRVSGRRAATGQWCNACRVMPATGAAWAGATSGDTRQEGRGCVRRGQKQSTGEREQRVGKCWMQGEQGVYQAGCDMCLQKRGGRAFAAWSRPGAAAGQQCPPQRRTASDGAGLSPAEAASSLQLRSACLRASLQLFCRAPPATLRAAGRKGWPCASRRQPGSGRPPPRHTRGCRLQGRAMAGGGGVSRRPGDQETREERHCFVGHAADDGGRQQSA